MNLLALGYALLCVLLPVLWGLLVVWVSNRIEAKFSRYKQAPPDPEEEAFPPIEYHI